MDIKTLGTVRELENGFTEFTFKPATIYPAVIERIRAVLDSGDIPDELVFPEQDFPDNYDVGFEARRLLQSLRLIPEQAWENALRPRDRFDNADEAVITERKNALEAALAWIMLACRVAAGEHYAMIYLERDPDFRL